MDVSIVLLTRNAGPGLEEGLAAIGGQRYDGGSLELLAVDSGSTDGTLDRLARAGARVLRIPPEEFDHGATRDFGISSSRGEIAVLLVQDAVPGSPMWLAGLAREFERTDVAATWCRQVARSDCPAVTAMRISEGLAGSTERRECRLGRAADWEAMSAWERMRLCGFDNVCSAVRKSVWAQLPFGRCAFAEDIAWSKRVIVAGHTITYTPEVHVVHSHDRSVWYEYKRTYLAHYSFQQLYSLRTIPRLSGAWQSLWTSGGWVRHALRHEPTLSRRLQGALRAPAERFATAIAQYQGARDAANGRAPTRFRGV